MCYLHIQKQNRESNCQWFQFLRPQVGFLCPLILRPLDGLTAVPCLPETPRTLQPRGCNKSLKSFNKSSHHRRGRYFIEEERG